IAGERGVAVDRAGLPGGVQRLLALARAVPERQGARRTQQRPDLLTRVGRSSLGFFAMTGDFISFLGEAVVGSGRLFVRRARLRRSDLMLAIEDCGPAALPIVALISFLVGLILAFVGAIQLQQFGAAIFVANLVGIAMVREMGAMMTAILMSGRTGAAFAANLGTMQVSDEVSALQTLGIPPMEFLVVPRVIALSLMMPLLTVFANIVGMLGGMLIGILMLDISPITYYQPDQRRRRSQRLGRRARQGVAVRGCRRDRRLRAGHALSTQRRGGRRRRHHCRGFVHRPNHYHRRHRHSDLHDPENMSEMGTGEEALRR